MEAAEHKRATVRPRSGRRVTSGLAVAIATGLVIAGCGASSKPNADSATVQRAIKARIEADAAHHHVPINEVECLVLSSTKLTCLAHVSYSKDPEEKTATVIASVDGADGGYLLEGPPYLTTSD